MRSFLYRFRLAFKKNNMLIKILFSYVFIGAISLSIFSYMLTNQVSEKLTADIHYATENAIQLSYNSAEILLSSVYNTFFEQYSRNPVIFEALYKNTFDQSKIGQVNKSLTDLTSLNPLVDSIYVYNKKAGLVFSTQSTVQITDAFFDQDMNRLIQETDRTPADTFIPRTVTYRINDKTYEKKFISIIFSEMKTGVPPDAVMVVNLDQGAFQGTVSKEKSGQENQIIIINNKGTIISHTDGSLINHNISDRRFIQTILESPEKQGRFTETYEDKQLLETYVKPNKLGWIYIGVYDDKSLLNQVALLKNSILVITATFLVIGILAATFFTNIIYVPMYRMLNRIRNFKLDQEIVTPLNEYDYISHSFDRLTQKVLLLQDNLHQSLPAQKKSMLQRILHGTAAQMSDIRTQIKNYDLNLKLPLYTVCILRLDSLHAIREIYSAPDIALFKYCMINISEETLKEHFPCEILEEPDDAIAILINSDDNDEWLSQKDHIFAEIQSNIQLYTKMTVTISFGSMVDSLDKLKISYRQALQASNYRILYGTNIVIPYNETMGKETEEHHYPDSIEKLLMDALKLGDTHKLNLTVDEFIHTLSRFSYNQIMLSLVQLVVMTLRTAKGMIHSNSDELRTNYDNVYKELQQWDTLEEIKKWYLALCGNIIEIRDEKSNKKNGDLIKRVLKYITENYHDPNISIEILADLVGLSPNYLRKIFKEETQQTVANFITELRFQKAKELLITTDYPANKIGELVGIQGNGYFYIAFKKYYGNSPNHFRAEHKKEMEEAE